MINHETRQAAGNARPLTGRCIGISISESNDVAAYGFTADSVNAITVDLARRLIALGATVALGHNWRTGGVMEAVTRFALAFKDQSASTEHHLILNYLAAPDLPSWSEADRKELTSLVGLQTVRWEEHQSALQQAISSDASSRRESASDRLKWEAETRRSGIRALNLTALRFVLAQVCDVRLVIGGRTTGYHGLAPGIIEEAWWSARLGKKVLVCTGMGGAAMAIARPDSEQASAVHDDTSHPLAGVYLKELHALSPDSTLTVISSLSAESILRHIVHG